MERINTNYDNMPKYLENLPTENIQILFDTFINRNDSDEEEFYNNQKEIDNGVRKKYQKRKMYKTIEEFECGYEKTYDENEIHSRLQQKGIKLQKVYLKDVLKLDYGGFKYALLEEIYQPQRKLKNIWLIEYHLPKLNFQNAKKKKIEENQKCYEFNHKDNKKIMIVSQNLNIHYEYLEPYIKNFYKYEDTSDLIEINNSENKQFKYQFKTFYFNEMLYNHKILFALSLSQLEKRASLLINSRFNESFKIISIILKFLVLLKKIHKEGSKKKVSSNIYDEKKSKNKNNKMIKAKNTILSYQYLKTFFQESNKSNREALIVSCFKSIIGDYEEKRRDEQYVLLKEKMRNIINEDENSDDNMFQVQNNDLDNMKIKYNKRNNKKSNSQTDYIALPQFIPQHQLKFKKNLKTYIQFQINGK